MLADEEWDDDELVEASEEPIAYEDFAKQVQAQRSCARRETRSSELKLYYMHLDAVFSY